MGVALPIIGLASTALGIGGKVLGGIAGANSQTSALEYQRAVAKNNMKLATYRMNQAEQQGEAASTAAGLQGRSRYGALAASEAASGVDVNSPSFVAARDTQARFNQLDAMTIKSNYAREVYNANLERQQYKTQARELKQAEPKWWQTLLGAVGGVTGGAGGVADKAIGYQQSGALPMDFFGNSSLDTSAVGASAMTPMDIGAAGGTSELLGPGIVAGMI